MSCEEGWEGNCGFYGWFGAWAKRNIIPYADSQISFKILTNDYNISVGGVTPLYTEPAAQTPNTYSPNAISSFTFKNLTEISIALLENNFTGTMMNTTMTYNTTHYTYNTTLAAGAYQYRFIMNGTTNIWNYTNLQTFTINKSASPIYLAINDNASAAQTYPYGTNTITAGWKNFTENVLILYKNNNIIQTAPLVSEVTTLAAGIYNYTLHYRENRNYTQNRTETALAISKAPSTCAISFSPNTPQNYGTSITIFANTSAEASYNSSVQLLQNGTQKTFGNGNQSYKFTPAAGIYGFYAHCSGNENYTKSATMENDYVINKASPTLTVGFNTTSPQNYGKPILLYGNISAGSGDQSATVTIYMNGTQVASGVGNQTYGILLGAGIYEFNVTYGESQNYISGSLNQTDMTIDKATPTLNLTLNGIAGNITISRCDSVNATAIKNTNEGTMRLYRGQKPLEMITLSGTSITNSTKVCGLIGEQSNFTAIYIESQNYTQTSKTLFATIDSENPTYANNATTAAQMNDTHWSANFTITWADNKAISNAWLENNFTGDMTNSTMSGNGLYYYNTTLVTGAYQYRFMANDTSSNQNTTGAMTFTLATTTTTTTMATTTTWGGTGGFPSQQQPATTTTMATTTTTTTTSTTTTTISETPVIKPEKLPLMRESIDISSQENVQSNEKPTDAITGLVTKNPVAAAASLILLIAIAANYAIGVEPIRNAATAMAKKLGLKKLLKLKKIR